MSQWLIGTQNQKLTGLNSDDNLRLDKVVIHYTKISKIRVAIVVVLGKAKMEPRLQPISVGPSWIVHFVRAIPEPAGVWFRNVELVVWDNTHSGGHD